MHNSLLFCRFHVQTVTEPPRKKTKLTSAENSGNPVKNFEESTSENDLPDETFDTGFHNLPEEMLDQIFSYELSDQDLLNFDITCARWRLNLMKIYPQRCQDILKKDPEVI